MLGLGGIDAGAGSPPPEASGNTGTGSGTAGARPQRSTEFIGALRFTLLYTLATTPFILLIGFVLALAVNHVGRRWQGPYISATLLPFIITPVVGALAIKWLFRDNGLVPHVLSQFGISVFWIVPLYTNDAAAEIGGGNTRRHPLIKKKPRDQSYQRSSI